jgi:Ca2+-binding RTX toxin-like protein
MTTFNGTTGNNTFSGSAANDIFNYGNVTLSGGTITGARGFDIISSGGGFDTLNFNFTIDHIYGDRVGNDLQLYIQPTTDWDDSNPTTTLGGVRITNFYAADGNGVIDRINCSDAYVLFTYSAGVERIGIYSLANVLVESEVLGSAGNDSLAGSAVVDYIEGALGNDTLSGLDGRDELYGDDGNDSLLGGNGNDFLSGANGNDTLNGGSGNDTVDGGAGTDTASYAGANGGVRVDLAFNSGGNGVQPSGNATNAGSDTLSGIENVLGGSFSDLLFGSETVNRLDGGAGNDSLYGRGGNDSLVGGTGSDYFDAGSGNGAGNDTMDGGTITDLLNYLDLNSIGYFGASAGVSVNLATGIATDGGGGTDTLRNINIVSGSNFNDTLTGSTRGLFEAFTLGQGNDRLDGGVITDTLNFVNSNRASFNINGGAAVTVDLQAGTATGQGSDTLVNINQVRGTNLADVLRGSNSTVISEVLEGGGGNDLLDGRGGFDTARYDYAGNGVIVSLVTNVGIVVPGADVDTLIAIEGLRGSHYNDVLTGGNTANAALEVFRGNGGNDTINGGAGFDRVDYVAAGRGITATLGGTADGRATDGLSILAGQVVANGTAGAVIGTDTLRNIEAVRGSSFNDTFNGSNIATEETFEGRKGADLIDGNGGLDRASYFTSTAGATVTLGLAGAAGVASDGWGTSDTLRDIENLQGSRDFGDRLTGNELANRLDGVGGKDTLAGGAGNDTLVGGAGNDILTGGAGNDLFRFDAPLSGTTNVDRLADFSAVADTIQLENAVFKALTATGTLAAGAFVLGTQAADASDRIVYNGATGSLYYDSDGSGAAAQILFATVVPGVAVTIADFVIS